MTRAAVLLALFGSLHLAAQTSTEVLDRTLLLRQAICGPIEMRARMVEASDLPVKPSQMVRVTLNNLNSKAIVLERVTLHFSNETPTSGAFEAEIKVPLGARREATFVQATTVQNPVSYVELNSVRYGDGSNWQPSDGAVCEIVPDPPRN